MLPLKTLTLAKHPEVDSTVLSVGRWSESHVFTSVALELALILEKTKEKSEAEPQLEIDGKLTFTAIPCGRIGVTEEERSACVNSTLRAA